MTSMRLPICAMMPFLGFCIGSKIWRSERESHLGEGKLYVYRFISVKPRKNRGNIGSYIINTTGHYTKLLVLRVPDVIEVFDGL